MNEADPEQADTHPRTGAPSTYPLPSNNNLPSNLPGQKQGYQTDRHTRAQLPIHNNSIVPLEFHEKWGVRTASSSSTRSYHWRSHRPLLLPSINNKMTMNSTKSMARLPATLPKSIPISAFESERREDKKRQLNDLAIVGTAINDAKFNAVAFLPQK